MTDYRVRQGCRGGGRRPPSGPTRRTEPLGPRHARALLRRDHLGPRRGRDAAGGGLDVNEGVYDLPTALESRAGDGDLVVAVCAEYDALPDVGHACGHNIIAATAVGAGLALASVADELGLTVRVLGTPGRGGRRRQGAHARTGRLRRRPRRHDGAPLADGAAHGELPRRGALRRPLQRTRGPRVGRTLGRGQRPGRHDDRAGGHRPPAPAAAAGRPGARRGHAELGRRQHHPGLGHGPLHGPLAHGRGPGGVAAPGRRLLRGGGAGHRVLPRLRGAVAGVLAHGGRPRPAGRPTGSTPRRSGRHFDADDDGTPLPTFSTDMANVSLAVPTIHPAHRH